MKDSSGVYTNLVAAVGAKIGGLLHPPGGLIDVIDLLRPHAFDSRATWVGTCNYLRQEDLGIRTDRDVD